MISNKYGTMIKVPRENRNIISFMKKKNEVVKNYVDIGIGNYVFFSNE
jgi:hypothetical protein